MQRRNFIKNTALSAIAISATGFVHFDGERYLGDCATTDKGEKSVTVYKRVMKWH
jgi:hypothetical protein